MSFTEQAIVFSCAGEQLLGIIAEPQRAKAVGVLLVVGGPQYRVGSHRQFVLLSRALARAGYPTMRFDYRGMGDSSGVLHDFEQVTEDIDAAIGAFLKARPQLQGVVLWGLCDAASANLLYWDATRDARVAGMILLNPWLRSEASLAKTHIKHYYGQRLLQADFWCKLLSGKLGIGRALGGLIGSVRNARQKNDEAAENRSLSFQKRMSRGLQNFPGQVLVLLSGNDYTAKEFCEAVRSDPAWTRMLTKSNVTQTEIAGADHTFSSAEWREEVENITRQWLETRTGL